MKTRWLHSVTLTTDLLVSPNHTHQLSAPRIEDALAHRAHSAGRRVSHEALPVILLPRLAHDSLAARPSFESGYAMHGSLAAERAARELAGMAWARFQDGSFQFLMSAAAVELATQGGLCA